MALLLALILCALSPAAFASHSAALPGNLAAGATCAITMTTPEAWASGDRSGSRFVSTVTCSGGVKPKLTAHGADAMGHSVTFTFNGVAQLYDKPLAEPLSSPALLSLGFGSSNAGTTLYVSVSASGLDGLLLVDGFSDGFSKYDVRFTAVQFGAVETLVIQDSMLSGINAPNSSNLWVQSPGTAALSFFEDVSNFVYQVAAPTILLHNVSIIQAFTSGHAPLHLGNIFTGYAAISLIDCRFESNRDTTPTQAESGYYIPSSGALMVEACTTYATEPQVVVNIESSTFTRCRGASHGGAVSLGYGCGLSIKDSTFEGNDGEGGGGAVVADPQIVGASVVIENSTFADNIAVGNGSPNACGGAVWAVNAALSVSQSRFSGNWVGATGRKGGALCFGRQALIGGAAPAPTTVVMDGQLTGLLVNTTFANNKVIPDESEGGAVFDWGSDGLTIDGCTFENCSAGSGGAVYSLWSQYLIVKGGSSFRGCEARYAYGLGGAIAVSDLVQNLTVDGVTFVGNNCTSEDTVGRPDGGALFVEFKRNEALSKAWPANFTTHVLHTSFENNGCHNGGALAISESYATIGPNVSFVGNIARAATGTGGALALRVYEAGLDINITLGGQPMEVNLTDVSFSNNSAPLRGGALHIASQWAPRLLDVLFDGNSASTEYTYSATEHAGGAYYQDKLAAGGMDLSNVTFNNNAAYTGGGLFGLQSNASLAACVFSGNTAGAGGGGGLAWYQAITEEAVCQLNLSDCSFSSNNADGSGGAVQINHGGAVVVNTAFSANTARVAGGALHLIACGPGDANSFNSAEPSDTRNHSAGGAVYVVDSSFDGNSAGVQGGGVATVATALVLSNASFVNNSAAIDGGGLYSPGCIGTWVHAGAFDGNSAGGRGGGLAADSCVLQVHATSLTRNKAGTSGGGVAAGLSVSDVAQGRTYTTYTVTLDGAAMSGNSAGGQGGGAAAEAVTLTLSGGSWDGNTAGDGGGAVAALRGSAVSVLGVTSMSGNVGGNGGAVFAEDAVLLRIGGSSISGSNNTSSTSNSTNSTSSTSSASVIAPPVSSPGDGGCVWASGVGCVVLSNSSVARCGTGGAGGGAWLATPASATAGCPPDLVPPGMTLPQPASSRRLASSPAVTHPTSLLLHALSISGCASGSSGGGLYLRLLPNSSVVMDAVTVDGNAAAGGDGGGLAVTMWAPPSVGEAPRGQAEVTILSSELTGNQALGGRGGGAAMGSGDPLLVLQVWVLGGRVAHNSAAMGGGLSVFGAGASLAVEQSALVESNAAVGGAGGIGGGGGVAAEACGGLLLGAGTLLVSCNATIAGGGLFVSGCAALVLKNASITGCSAPTGGGAHIANTPGALLMSSAIAHNAATGGYAGAADAPSDTANFVGSGGGLWIGGATSALVHGCLLVGNTAGTLGGGIAALQPACGGPGTILLFSAATWLASFPQLLSSYSPQLSPLADAIEAGGGCHALHLSSCRLANNTAAGSGGALFVGGARMLRLVGNGACEAVAANEGLLSPPPPTALSSAPPPNAPSLLATLASECGNGLGNTVLGGYGPLVATLPVGLAAGGDVRQGPLHHGLVTAQVETLPVGLAADDVHQIDMNDASKSYVESVVPAVRLSGDGILVFPSTSPLTYVELPLRVIDGAGQDVADPVLSPAIAVTVTDPIGDDSELLLRGAHTGAYDATRRTYVLTGLTFTARVGQDYTLAYTLATSPGGGDLVSVMSQVVRVPDCGDGETYILNKTACYRCRDGTYAFSRAPGYPAEFCLPCPEGSSCSGGAVLVPDSSGWHSSAKSYEVHECPNPEACTRDKDRTAQLQACQAAWHAFDNAQLDLTEDERLRYGQAVLNAHQCILLDTVSLSEPSAYLSLLCANGYGGNLCAVCIPNSEGQMTASQGSNFHCGVCAAVWQVVLSIAGFFVLGLLTIMIQVIGALGEDIRPGEITFTDITSLMIAHVQYLVIVLSMGMMWPRSVTVISVGVSSVVSLAEVTQRVTSLACLSDGSPESQAEYMMAGGLVIPAILIATSLALWAATFYVRTRILWPRLRRGRWAQRSELQTLPLSSNKDEASGGHIEGTPAHGVAEANEESQVPPLQLLPGGVPSFGGGPPLALGGGAPDNGSGSSGDGGGGSSSSGGGGDSSPSAPRSPSRDSPSAPGSPSWRNSLSAPRSPSSTLLARLSESRRSARVSPTPPPAAGSVPQRFRTSRSDSGTGTSSPLRLLPQQQRGPASPAAEAGPESERSSKTQAAALWAMPVANGAGSPFQSPTKHNVPEPLARHVSMPREFLHHSSFGPRDLLTHSSLGREPGGSSAMPMGNSYAPPVHLTASGLGLDLPSFRTSPHSGRVAPGGGKIECPEARASAPLPLPSSEQRISGSGLALASATSLPLGKIEEDKAYNNDSALNANHPRTSPSGRGLWTSGSGRVHPVVVGAGAGSGRIGSSPALAMHGGRPPRRSDETDGSGSARSSGDGAGVPGKSWEKQGTLNRGISQRTGDVFDERLTNSSGWFIKVFDEDAPTLTGDTNSAPMSLLQKICHLDETMPLRHQLVAVGINAAFVVYQGWASAALNAFACLTLDDGIPSESQPEWAGYYASFQRATATHGYWQLNMDQACYAGRHLSLWTPVGVLCSCVICLGVPLAMFLPLWLQRSRLSNLEVQFRYGWLYMRYAYARVPYWASVAQLEMLVLMLVQVFSSSLASVMQQAALLQITLLIFVFINTVVWPMSNPLLVLLSFCSFAVLILTVSMAMLIGDGSHAMNEGGAVAIGACIVLVNVAFLAILVVVSFKHLRRLVRDGFMEYEEKASVYVKKIADSSRSLRRMASSRLSSGSVRLRSIIVRATSGGSFRARASLAMDVFAARRVAEEARAASAAAAITTAGTPGSGAAGSGGGGGEQAALPRLSLVQVASLAAAQQRVACAREQQEGEEQGDKQA
ncbi:hypothetical protein FOA52_014514 [Chlamydomonas sp. UWO 241]|nr:hypothetical protein FOA52_014514 [Chlamydomonas sp. UWO 241]